MTEHRHLTTRRGFLAGMGFGGVTLYGLWAAYGVAPGPLALLGHASDYSPGEGHGAAPDIGHAGHGAAPDGPTSDEFRRMIGAFVERYGQPDGSVYPRRESAPAMPEDGHAGHAAHAASTGAAGDDDQPVEVFLLAEKWYYEPAHLRLDRGETYRLRMMATDVSHGASIQFGRGGRMVRLRPNREAALLVTFTQPGSFLVYCTVYCGQAHDFMQARIEVV